METKTELTNGPLVSIIMTTYNRAEWLPKSIGSVLSQTYLNWELIIWNDGSSDNTVDVINSYSDQRIRYYFEKNHGMSYALNKSLELCQGKYIAFIDDDDLWDKNKLMIQVDILEKYNAELLFTNFINVEYEQNKQFVWFDQCKEGLSYIEISKADNKVSLIIKGMPEGLYLSNLILPSTVLVKKEIINRVGGFNEGLKSAMDLDLWWRMGLAGVKFAFTNEILVTRNHLPSGLSRSNISVYEARIKCFDLAVKEIKEHNRPDLFPFIKKAYKYPLKMLIHDFALNGDRIAAMKVFTKSVKLGIINLREVYYLLGGLLGPKFVNEVLKNKDR